jgi:hypothetical protein
VRVADLSARLPQFGTTEALMGLLRGLEQGRIAHLFLAPGDPANQGNAQGPCGH